MKKSFNLLKPQVEAPSVWTKVYDWVTGTAKVILVITIIVVFISLLIKIGLDVKENNLDKEITSLENLLHVRNVEEKKYRHLQTKVNSYEKIWNSTILFHPIIDETTKFLPKSAIELVMTIEEKGISLTGKALNNDIDEMENAIKSNKSFYESKLSRLETSPESGQNFVKFNFLANNENSILLKRSNIE